MGNGPGGSSAVYGAALERFSRADFAPVSSDELDAGLLPREWPIPYDEFAPWYAKAESLLRVCGGPDPTCPEASGGVRPPPALSSIGREFFALFQAAGLSPYRLHVGIDYKPGCVECLGVICPRDCKSDGASRALKPALKDHGARLLTRVTVDRVELAPAGAPAVIAQGDAGVLRLRARVVLLAAGALSTPGILLRSRSERWPQGLGNDHGLVGRGLMFHVLQYFAAWPKGRHKPGGFAKELSCRGLSANESENLGTLQSLARSVAVSQIWEHLREVAPRFIHARSPIVSLPLLMVSAVAANVFRGAALFALQLEDFAHKENRVEPDPASPSGIRVTYAFSDELVGRIRTVRRRLSDRLASARPFFLTRERTLNLGHPMGTCRFGKSPASSVLTPENMVWDAPGIYVVDASFMPSGASVNPSLTIAANALRVADLLAARLSRPSITVEAPEAV